MLPAEEIILRAALHPNKKSADDWLSYRNSTPNVELPNMLNSCGGYIYKNLLGMGIQDDYLKGIYKHNWTSNSYRLQRLIPILREISKESIITPIKSFGLNEKHFKLGFRSIGDFDFFFDLKTFPHIRKVMKENAFELFMGISEEELTDKIFTSRGSWSYKRGLIDDLDLHWKVFDERDLKFNMNILNAHSFRKSAPWGEHLQLTNEMSSIVISHHHYLQGGLNYSGLCDLKHLLNESDLEKVLEIAKEIDMVDVIQDQIEIIESFSSRKSISTKTYQRNISTGRVAQIFTFIQVATLRLPLLYKTWIRLGAKSKVEKLIIYFFGTFSNPKSYMKNAIKLVDLSKNLMLGTGWHYRYPGDIAQWTTYPDTRVLIESFFKSKLNLQIELEQQVWQVSIPESVECFMNGKFIGAINKNSYFFEFKIDVKKGWNELSFRARKPWNRDLTSIDYNWQRLMMPVKAIRVS